jgi:hypothetical protein
MPGRLRAATTRLSRHSTERRSPPEADTERADVTRRFASERATEEGGEALHGANVALIVGLLHKSGLCRRFPVEALQLQNTVIADQQWAPQELGQCLDEIAEAAPNLAQDARYLRLREYLRRQGI